MMSRLNQECKDIALQILVVESIEDLIYRVKILNKVAI